MLSKPGQKMLAAEERTVDALTNSKGDISGRPTKKRRCSLAPELDTELSHKFVVLEIQNTSSFSRKLVLRSTENEHVYFCEVSGQWTYNQIVVGDFVSISSTVFKNNTFEVDNDQGLIVINPDELISCTTVASSVFCMRKSWLNEKFRGWSSGNKAMLVGTIVHELFQAVCAEKIEEKSKVLKLVDEILNTDNVRLQCYACKVDEVQLKKDVQEYIPFIQEWISKYMIKGPSPLEGSSSKIEVIRVHDIEDNIWMPRLGLKGKVDVTAEVQIHKPGTKPQTRKIPLELKTGKPSFTAEHKGQAALYSMMMDKRQGEDCDSGLLLYLKDGVKMQEIVLSSSSKQALIMRRNDLASYNRLSDRGPEFKESMHFCTKCEHLLDCSLMAQNFELEKLKQSSVMQTLVPATLQHLKPSHVEFFGKWFTFLSMEMEAERTSAKKKGMEVFFWNESSIRREQNGVGLSRMRITEHSTLSYHFVRRGSFADLAPSQEAVGNIKINERVHISIDEDSQNNMIAISSGYVRSNCNGKLEVSVDKKIPDDLIESTFRIDVAGGSSSMFATNFTNILRLMSMDEQRCAKLRETIIDKKEPIFKTQFKKEVVEKGKHILCDYLNQAQQRAVLKTLSTNDYLLLQGMPGAGKTQTIVAIIRILVALNKTVLVTSYTHSAVDNILLKLKQKGDVQFLRLGSLSRIHPELHEYSCAKLTEDITTLPDLQAFYAKQKVIAATCLGVYSHPLFDVREAFDYCVMDEASQVLLPACIGPLFACDKFILVGDSKQLPPVVRCKKAADMGMNQSIFSTLQSRENTVELTIQYRMNSEIMAIANKLTYNDSLTCGSKAVANATLSTDGIDFEEPWIASTLDGTLTSSVRFLNTDPTEGVMSSDASGFVYNVTEGLLVKRLCEVLVSRMNISPKQIGVVTPYQRQVQHLKSVLLKETVLEHMEINTVDQYQGRDKDVILISCVRSAKNAPTDAEGILNDERRLNVAVTRARKKLIIIGSESTLKSYAPFKELLNVLRPDQIIALPHSCVKLETL